MMWVFPPVFFCFFLQGAHALNGKISPAAHIFSFLFEGPELSEAASEGPLTESLKTHGPVQLPG